MLSRSWLGALGLRGRIVGAVLITAVTVLVVAALVLLPRLESSLRVAAQQTLRNGLSSEAIKPISEVPLRYLPAGPRGIDPDFTQANQELHDLADQEINLGKRVGAQSVIVIGYIDNSGTGTAILPKDRPEMGSVDANAIADAWFSKVRQKGITTNGGTQYAFEAIPNPKKDTVLWVTTPINEIDLAVHTVRFAFILAALAGLAATFLLVIPLSATVVRRLRRLREAAVRLAADGFGAELPVDRSRDEVGDLSRTFVLMQSRLRQQEAARRAFVATASHELRTPLASLDLMLELLAEDLKAGSVDIDDAQSLLERARAQSRRLGRLAADLLDLSRIDADVTLRSEAVELGELCRAVLAEFELGSRDRNVSFVLHDPDGPVWALGDPSAVAQILRILVDNALRVSPPESEICVTMSAGPWPTLSVSDRGPGVPAEEREMIFERFKRGTGTAGAAGFGLGLAIGRELAQRMGGTLQLGPEADGGATFTLTLRVASAPLEERVPSTVNP